ncbi:vWA domain-containing protein [Micromonospora narathiwatensis]|uniref:vWA domain-containing protein n=1 Tax=Micromonospora narathiwatensis TaxID=299146 RepID=UPI0012FD3743|nr:substrate-binding domain-containing protein [Micromonospora narathiwatensis]
MSGAELVKEQATNNWLVLIGAIVAFAVQLWFTDFRRFVYWLLEWIELLYGAVPRRVRRAVAGALAVLLLGAVTMVVVVWRSADGDCPHTTELRILTSPEGLQTTREVAQQYARSTARDNGGCPTVFPFVYAAGTASVSGALARGWVDSRTEHPLVDLGPRPDVWLPDSTLDVRQVRDILARTLPEDETAKGRLPPPLRRITSIASSPIVLAGSAASAARDDAATLSRLVSALLDSPGSSLSAADPESSTAGLLAAAAYLHDGRDRMVDPVVARRREQIVLNSTISGTDEVSLLCAHLRTGQLPVAVLTSLRTWRRLTAGRALGGAGCQAPIDPPAILGTVGPAVAEGPNLDHPFVQFAWTGARHSQAVDAFRDWLLDGRTRPYLSEVGLDPPIAGCASLDRNPCVPGDLAATLELYRQAKLSGRVLLAVDASGSMAESAGSGKVTRFTVAAQGVVEALGQLGPHDEFGLWSFPGANGRNSHELVGIAAGSPRHREVAAGALRGVRPAGATPLYTTILAGMRAVAAGGDDKRIRALVVLTDGEDTSSGRSLRQMAQQVRELAGASGVRLYVIATGDARCEDIKGREGTGLHLLTDVSHGECLPASPGRVPGTMAQLFATLWSGR